MEIGLFKDIYDYLSEKFTNKKIFIISDHHFYHKNIINFMRNKFSSVEEMNSYIIEKHNEIVSKEDIVIFLGDFSFDFSRISEINDRLNGIKFLLLGNHDNHKIIKNYKLLGFENVFLFSVRLQDTFLSHYPLLSDEDSSYDAKIKLSEFLRNKQNINYHGHIHHNNNQLHNSLNVTCDVMEYKPLFWGYTRSKIGIDKNLINNSIFSEILDDVSIKHSCTKKHVFIDFLYSSILAQITEFGSSYYVYGSYGFYKKYNFISNFSDLDISYFFDDNRSKSQNFRDFKHFVNTVINKVNNNYMIQVEFYKRFENISIIFCHYSNGLGLNITAPIDMNCMTIPFFDPNDYISMRNKTLIENTIPGLSNDYILPNYENLYYSDNAELANLLLQLFFQNNSYEKEVLIIKKINYLCQKKIKIDFFILEETIIRYFLRNIYFFCCRSRYEEIKYIKFKEILIDKYIGKLKSEILYFVKYIFLDKTSRFNKCFETVFDSDEKCYIVNTCMDLIKTKKYQLK